MRKATIVAAAITLMVTGIAFVTAKSDSVAQSTIMSAFELMTKAKDLPVAANPDAF